VFQTNGVRKIKTHFVFSNFSIRKPCHLRQCTKLLWSWRGHRKYNTAHALGILDKWAPNTLSEYVILIAFPLKQWLHERASVLRCTFTVYLVTFACTLVIPLYVEPTTASSIIKAQLFSYSQNSYSRMFRLTIYAIF
jgi:hypothetical protein